MGYPLDFKYPLGVYSTGWGCGMKSLNAKRCDDIEEQLAVHHLFANVSRHTLFNKAMYIVSFNKDNGGGEFPSVGKIAKALEIPDSWVNLYECSATDTQYAVLEKELNGKHKNNDGRLEWEQFNFYEAVNSGNPNSRIKKQLKSCRRVVSCYKDEGIILIDSSSSAKCVADELGICEESVIDASCTLKESGITHIIIIEEA